MASDGVSTVALKCGLVIQGCIMTTFEGRQFIAFKGIPYAEPPTGNLRFKPPVRKVWNAHNFEATSEIESIQFDMMTNTLIGQEDCLILNVFTKKTQNKCPVIVFIHGGAYCSGSGIMYGPRKLLDQDVVLVTINYRLHVFGFLSTSDKVSPGNYGLLDQIVALQWVQDNIDVFGGDPNCVTVIGHSAAAGVKLMYNIIGLFHRAVLMSGNSLCSWALSKNPKYWTIKVARAAGCESSDSAEIVDYLRELPAVKLTKIHSKLCKEVLVPMSPVVDGHVLLDNPQTLLEKGLIVNRVPVLIGVTKNEGLTFLPSNIYVLDKKNAGLSFFEFIRLATAMPLDIELKRISSETRELIENYYFKLIDPKDVESVEKAAVKVCSDGAFKVAHHHVVNLLVNAGVEIYVYSSDYVTEYSIAALRGVNMRGVGHADDLFFLFDCPKVYPLHYESPNNSTENNFLQIWTNFARS
uniref:Carboxylesterase type B domain-containing protein n=1 Tax=Strigamia maritima TaxID=126957 RepID=T1IRA2_STRMM